MRAKSSLCVTAEALKKDMKLLDSSTQEAGRGKTLVPKAIDADDEDDPGEADDDSEDDDEVRRHVCHRRDQRLCPVCNARALLISCIGG